MMAMMMMMMMMTTTTTTTMMINMMTSSITVLGGGKVVVDSHMSRSSTAALKYRVCIPSRRGLSRCSLVAYLPPLRQQPH
jgi:hypothetical protein